METSRRTLLNAFGLGLGAIPFGVYNNEITANAYSTAASTADESWPMYKTDPTNTARSITNSGPEDDFELAWSLSLDLPTTRGNASRGGFSATSDGNSLYIGTNDGVTAIDTNGNPLWVDQTSSVSGPSPAVGDDRIIVGFQGELRAYNKRNGDEIWTFDMNGNPWFTSAQIDNGIVYSSARSGGYWRTGAVVAVDARTGTEQWTHSVSSSYVQEPNPPAVGRNLVFQSAEVDRSPGEYILFAVDKQTGEEVWSTREDGYAGPLTLRNGTLYIANGIIGNYVKAFDVDTGIKQWEVNHESSDVAAGDNLILSAGFGSLLALDSRGNSQWEFETESSAGGVVMVNNLIYFLTADSLYCLDRSGNLLWEFDYADHGNFYNKSFANPIVVNGAVYFASGDEFYKLVEDPNTPPTASFGYTPETPMTNEPVTFDATDSSDDAGIVDYLWDFTGDGTHDKDGPIVEHVFVESGTREVELTVVDEFGLEDTHRTGVTISRPERAPEASFEFSPQEPQRGDEVMFDASGSSSPDGTIIEYDWEIDGSSMDGQQVAHTFDSPGEYTVSLTTRDDNGLSDSTQQIVTVSDNPLTLSLTGTRTTVDVGEEAIINLSVVSYITESDMEIQLILRRPSGIGVSQITGADEGSGQVTASTVIEPGSETNMGIRLQPNEPGTFDIDGELIYVTEQGPEGDRAIETFTITAHSDPEADEPDTPEETDEGSEPSTADEEAPDSSPIEDDEPEEESAQDDDAIGSGFGVLSGIAGLGGAGYYLIRRTTSNKHNDEDE